MQKVLKNYIVDYKNIKLYINREELYSRLAVIDETYFTEERLQTILANSQETNNINATSLNGFVSSDFAKVNQLSNYAPVSHNHSISQITGLYDYQITASKYNVDIGTDVTITVKVTNRATGQPVVGVSVPVLKNNQSWKTGTTGSNGSFSLNYTADTWGLVMFSANNSNIQINVRGWKFIQDGSMSGAIIKMYRNEQNGYIYSHSAMNTLSTGTTTFNNMFPTQMIPSMTVTLPMNNSSGNNNKILLQRGASSIMVDANSTSAKSTHFGLVYPLLNP